MRLARNRAWARRLLLGLGFLLIGFLVWVFFGRTLPSTFKEDRESKQAQTQPQPGAQPHPSPPATAPAQVQADSLENQLKQVITEIREANQKKDLPQLLSHYSSNFPQLPQRTQAISKAWKMYDYPRMDFEVHEVRLLSNNRAKARVTWQVEVKKIHDLTVKRTSNTYLINFVKESGQWRILSTELIK